MENWGMAGRTGGEVEEAEGGWERVRVASVPNLAAALGGIWRTLAGPGGMWVSVGKFFGSLAEDPELLFVKADFLAPPREDKLPSRSGGGGEEGGEERGEGGGDTEEVSRESSRFLWVFLRVRDLRVRGKRYWLNFSLPGEGS
jgi:hypothetical protein